jgi:hypothetical protein
MSLGKQLVERLRRLAAGDLEGAALEGDGKALSVSDQQLRARLEFFDHDRYSVAVRELVVGDDGPAPGDVQTYLSATAADIARRMSYLEEPLAVWELEGSAGMAQLRSSPPQREGDEVSFWEVTLWAGPQSGARIMRYRWASGMVEREVVAYPATFTLVARMADSLAEALQAAGE